MSNQEIKSFDFNFVELIQIWWKHRNKLIIIGAVAIIAASIFSAPFFIKPKFKSTAVFYPTTNNSISNALLTELNTRANDPLEFGEEEEAEKALQILQSSKLQDRLIKNFDLMKHYNIKNSNTPNTDLAKKISSNIQFARTRYLSIKIEVLDHDPVMAQQIANGVLNLYDTIKNEIQAEVAIPALAIVKRTLDAKEAQVESIRASMRKIGELGVTNYEEQSRALAEEIYKARANGNMGKVNDLMDQQKTLVEYGGNSISLKEQLELEEQKLSDLRLKFEKAQVDVNEKLQNLFVVSTADQPEKKSYPVRWLIVLTTLITTLLFAGIAIFIYEKMVK
mgnify:CR=1 FL=1